MPSHPARKRSRSSRRSEGAYHYNLIIQRRKRRRLFRIGLFLLTILMLLGGIRLHKVYRDWDLGRKTRQAQDCLATGKLDAARQLAQTVLETRQNDTAMLRVIHAVMVAKKEPGAANLARYLARESTTDEAARLSAFQDVCAELPLPSVLHSWLTLPASDRKRADYVKPFATRLIEQNMPTEADQVLQQHLQSSGDLEIQLLQVRVSLSKGGSSDLDRAQKKIADLMEQGGTTGLSAFRLLSHVPLDRFRSGYFPEVAPWLERQQETTPADKLLGQIQELQRNPSDKSRIAAVAIKTHGTKDPMACARWLRGLGMSREALSLGIGVDPAAWSPIKAELLADLRQWKELEEWLSTTPRGLTPVETATWRAIAAEKLGDEVLRRSQWNLILAEAKVVKSSNVLLDASAKIHAAGLEEMGREALLEAVVLKRGRLPLWDSIRPLVPWLRKADRGDRLASLFQIMGELDFTSPEPRLERIDLSYLLEECQPEAALGMLDDLEKSYPKLVADSRYHEVRATVLLGNGKAKDALAALDDPRQNRRLSSPRRTTVTNLAKAELAKAEFTTKGIPSPAELRSSIPWTDLIREERQFFNKLMDPVAAK